MGEACGLEWVKVDFDRRVLSIQPSAEHPGLKTVSSERPIKPFRKLWPILAEWRANRLNERLVFPRPTSPGESWFLNVLGSAKPNHVSRELSQALVAAGMTKTQACEPQRRARRYWETRLRSIGRTDLVALMSGHSPQVGLDHYTDALQVVQKVTGDDF